MRQANPLDIWILRWVVCPFLVLFFTWMFGSYQVERYRCHQIAKELGYLESTYIPRREECVCRMKRNPDGSINVTAERVVDLKEWKRSKKTKPALNE
jgi:hypothetical protein